MSTERTATIAWYLIKAQEVEALAAVRTGEVRKSLLRSAAQYRQTAASIEGRS